MAEERRSRRNEDLLEAIYDIIQEKGYAKSRDIALALQITPATVTDGFKRLSEAGLVHYEPYGGVTLTETGSSIALQTKDSHQTIQRLLELAGVDPHTADQDACVMEHGLSPDSCACLHRITQFIEDCLEDEKLYDRFQRVVHEKKDR